MSEKRKELSCAQLVAIFVLVLFIGLMIIYLLTLNNT